MPASGALRLGEPWREYYSHDDLAQAGPETQTRWGTAEQCRPHNELTTSCARQHTSRRNTVYVPIHYIHRPSARNPSKLVAI